MFYITTTPWWLKSLFPRGLTWEGDASDKTLYLTFDDGPHPDITSFVLEHLDTYRAKGTFFCLGENVERFPEMYERILAEGHRVGNHTQTHPSGWEISAEAYLAEIKRAGVLIDSTLFRPPYGKITSRQAAAIKEEIPGMRIIMWTGVTGDFDTRKTGNWCAQRAIRFCRPGGIIVFHDSEKAFPRLKIALPALLEYIGSHGFRTGLL